MYIKLKYYRRGDDSGLSQESPRIFKSKKSCLSYIISNIYDPASITVLDEEHQPVKTISGRYNIINFLEK